MHDEKHVLQFLVTDKCVQFFTMLCVAGVGCETIAFEQSVDLDTNFRRPVDFPERCSHYSRPPVCCQGPGEELRLPDGKCFEDIYVVFV